MESIAAALAAELALNPAYVENVITLMDEGNTITGRNSTAAWTILPSAAWLTG